MRVFLVLATFLFQDAAPVGVEFMDGWSRWSTDAIKAWQAAKVLHGNDLQKAKSLAPLIDANWIRFKKAGNVEIAFNKNARSAWLDSCAADIEGSVKKDKIALRKMRVELEGSLAANTTRKRCLYATQQDLESLRILMDSRLKEAKDLKPEKKTELEKHVESVRVHQVAIFEACQWSDGAEERITKLIGLIDDLLKLL